MDPMTRDIYIKKKSYHSVSERKMAQTKAILYAEISIFHLSVWLCAHTSITHTP